MAEQKQSSKIKQILISIVKNIWFKILIILIILASLIYMKLREWDIQDKIRQEEYKQQEIAREKKEQLRLKKYGKWQSMQEHDEFRDEYSDTVFVETRAYDPGGDMYKKLVITCEHSKNHDTRRTIYLWLGSDYWIAYGNENVEYKIDNGSIKYDNWRRVQIGLDIANRKLIDELKKSKKFEVRYYNKSDREVNLTFETSKLAANLKLMNKKCGL